VDENVDRVEPDDPERCSQSTSVGQCRIRRLEGSTKCKLHDMGKTARRELMDYKFTQYQARLEQFTDSKAMFSLKQEIAVIRMTLEMMVNTFRSPEEFLIHNQKIVQTISAINKIVVDAKKLESSLGLLMDQATLQGLVAALIGAIAPFIPDDRMTQAVQAIDAALTKALKEKSDES